MYKNYVCGMANIFQIVILRFLHIFEWAKKILEYLEKLRSSTRFRTRTDSSKSSKIFKLQLLYTESIRLRIND